MIKYILIIALVVLVLITPTYCLVKLPEEQKIRGCKLPLIIALWLKITCFQNVLFIDYKTFSNLWNQVGKSE